MRDTDPGTGRSCREAVDWLCRAQDYSTTHDGGVARHFCLIHGWGPSYPETTGYIVPTLLACEREFSRTDLEERALRMLRWLVSIQFPEGGFQGGTVNDTPRVPVVFNTGQILIGLAAGFERFGEEFREPMRAAADWLVSIQDRDGVWRRHGSPFTKSTAERAYDTHVALGLFEAARVSKESRWFDAAMLHVRNAVKYRCEKNGFVKSCCLMDPENPYTHTLGYYLRGMCEGALVSRDRVLVESTTDLARRLSSLVGENGFLPGKIHASWTPSVTWSCLTGSVQIAESMLLLYGLTGDRALYDTGKRLNAFVRTTMQVQPRLGELDDGTIGGVKGTYPTFGRYNHHQYLNWAAKFFIDSNLLESKVESAGAERSA